MAIKRVSFGEWINTIDETALTTILNDYTPFSYRNAEGELVRGKEPILPPKKIIPLTCPCCGGKINNNKCIYCDTEFYIER